MFTGRILRAAVVCGLALGANHAYAACTFSGSGEPSLQSTLDELLGSDTVDVQTACLADGADEAWSTVGQVGTVEINIELAGNHRSNTFGIYDLVTGTQVRIFEGDDGAGVLGIVELSRFNNQWRVRVRDTHGNAADRRWGSYVTLSSSAFGFYLGTTSNGTFFSDTSRNADGQDHMYAYGPLTGGFAGNYVIAWEDLFGAGDRDYQDFVATLVDITPVPLPTAAWLLLSGLVGLVGVARRRS